MGAFETFVPRLIPGAQTFTRADGSAVILSGHRVLEVAADQAQLLELMDGTRSLADISGEHYQRSKFVPFQAMVDLLSTLRTRDLLANSLAEIEQAGIPLLRSTSPGEGLVIGRLPIPRLAGAGLALLSVLALIAWAAAVFTGRLQGTVALHAAVLGPGDSPLLGLVFALAGASAALTLRSLLRSGLAALWGAPNRHLELRLRGVVPTLELEGGPVTVLARAQRIACHGAALVAPWAIALAAATLFPAAVASPLTLGALVVGITDLCPFAPTSLGHGLAALAGRVDLRDHARSYLSRKLLARRGQRPLFAGERVILATSVLSVAWCALAVYLAARGVPGAIGSLINSGLPLGGLEAAGAGLYILVLVGGSIVTLGLLVRLVLSALASAVPASVRERGSAARAPLSPSLSSPSTLRRVKLFSGLPEAALGELTQEVQQARFEPGAVILAQGSSSDRLHAIIEGTVAVVREAESGLERPVASLGAGDSFGEVALSSPGPAPATFRAIEPVLILELSRESFLKLEQGPSGKDLTRIIRAAAALHRNPLLGRMAPERIASLLPKLALVSIEAGKPAVTRGEPGDFFYIVDRGELEVLDPKDDQKPIARLKDGDYFGEIALLRNVPRTATVRATQPTSLWSLSKADFFGVLGRDLVLSQAVEAQARDRMR